MKSPYAEPWCRHRTSVVERGQWVRRYERSGLSRASFARQHGLGLSTLGRWLAEPAMPGAELREVSLSAAFSACPWVAEVLRPDGCVVRLAAHAPATLVQLVLASRPC